LLIQRKAALLRGKSALPAESGTRGSYHGGRRNDRGPNTVNSRLAIVENWRDIAEAGRSVDRCRHVAIIPRIIRGPGASNELGRRLEGGTHCARRSTPASIRSRRNSKLRTCLCQLKDQKKGQSRPEDHFRFHGTAMLPYINAHELAACNSDSCSLCGNLRFARRLRVRRIDCRSLQIIPRFSGQATRRPDPDSLPPSEATIQSYRPLGF
jgi:hypothetical protein